MLPQLICLLGPTASGKTPLAVELVQRFPLSIISVDSAMVYRDMNIGTAKPSADILKIAPHRLIDLLDPSEVYSAGQFRQDALREIDDILQQEQTPLLVGGSMLYFRILTQGLAPLPKADPETRATLQARMQQEGVEALHAFLASVDPIAASRIQPRDGQRIQRALEVYLLTGKTITAWQTEATRPLSGYKVHFLCLAPSDRAALHSRIERRFDEMLEQGFIEEVKRLYERGDLTTELPSIRSVGYSQAWQYLAGVCDYQAMREQAIAATRQLAKRQMTWLRSWPEITWFDADARDVQDQVFQYIATMR